VRDELLAGATFARDQERHIGIGHAIDQVLDLLHRRARADHLIETSGLGDLPTQALDLVTKPAMLDRSREGKAQGLDIERLGDEVVGADAERVDCGVHAAERGDDHHRDIGAVGDDSFAEREAAHPFHVQVADHDIEVLLVEHYKRLAGRGSPGHPEATPRHRLGQGLCHALVVVDDQHMAVHTSTVKTP
jgi:hypothetical protein